MPIRRAVIALACFFAACGGVARASAPVLPAEAPSRSEVLDGAGLEPLLRTHSKLGPLVEQASTYRLQVLVSVPEPGTGRWLRRDGFRVDAEYFYPASAIKVAIAAAALEAVTELRESSAPGAPASLLDSRALFSSARRRGTTSIARLVQASLVVSSNEASNDLFDLAGYDGVHERLWRAGLSSVRVRHRLGTPLDDDPRTTPAVELAPAGDSGSISIAAREGKLALDRNDEPGVQVGDSHFSPSGRLVNEPMSFQEKNRISLFDLQDLLVSVVRPELRAEGERLRLGEPERKVLVAALSSVPSSSEEPRHKPLLVGMKRVVPPSALTVASKAGRAYGFVVDNAYAEDARTGRAFFLTVAVYANANGRINDDTYRYDDFAVPVLGDIGELVARDVFEDGSSG